MLSLGYMPPVNQMVPIGQVPRQQPWFPTDLLHCRTCDLVQLGLAVDPVIIFPPEYPYTSGTTKLLRDNFADLQRESAALLGLTEKDLVVDIGSNDGTLISNFQKAGNRILGIEPTDVGDIANSRGIPTIKRYFGKAAAKEVLASHGPAKLITAANCFAHIEDVHAIVEGIVEMLAPDGVFISESHYLIGLLDTLQYDTVYHEHLRYYSVASLKHLLEMHGLEVFHARPIPSHGGSIRVYAGRKGQHKIEPSVQKMLDAEPRGEAMAKRLKEFKHDVLLSKLRLLAMLKDLKEKNARVVGISAPSRASTLFFSAQALTCFCIAAFPAGTQWSQKPIDSLPAAAAVRMCTSGRAAAVAPIFKALRRVIRPAVGLDIVAPLHSRYGPAGYEPESRGFIPRAGS